MKKSKGDVYWHLPNRKKTIAYSTMYASLLIVMMAHQYDTIQEIHDAINYDYEAKAILQKYIDHDYGNLVAKSIFW